MLFFIMPEASGEKWALLDKSMNRKYIPLLVFAIFWVITLTFYFKTAGAGFVTDEIGWLQNYQSTGWWGILNAFSDKSPHYVYHLFGFSLWKLFGFNGYAWMLFFISSHALVATLSFTFFKKLFSKTKISSPAFVAFGGGLIFLLSPYHTEPVVWYACVHYLICAVFVLLALEAYLKYNETPQQVFMGLFYLFAFLSAFTLEISFSLPLIVTMLILFFPFGNTDAVKGKQMLLFVVPSMLMVVFYFAVTKILRGNFAGHYGAATHFNMDIHLLMGNLAKYTAKVFALTQFLSYEKRNALYTLFEKEKFAFLLAMLLSFTAIVFVVGQKPLSKKLAVIGILFSMFVLALLPILNLYFSFIVNVEGDRFTYFASVFAGQLVAFSLVSLLNVFGWIPIGLFLFFSGKNLQINTESWQHNRDINFSLCEKFRWYEAPHIYLLNIPDNFNGTYMFRSFAPDNSFAETLALKNSKDVEGKITEIFEYNMTQPDDSVYVEKISDTELKVSFAQSGNWWWSKGIGGSNYVTESYEARIDGGSYYIVFKNKIAGAVYLYQCGDEWRDVKEF